MFSQEAIDSSLCSSAQSFVELLLQEVLVLLQSPDSSEGDQLLKKHCLRAGRVVDFLLDILIRHFNTPHRTSCLFDELVLVAIRYKQI